MSQLVGQIVAQPGFLEMLGKAIGALAIILAVIVGGIVIWIGTIVTRGSGTPAFVIGGILIGLAVIGIIVWVSVAVVKHQKEVKRQEESAKEVYIVGLKKDLDAALADPNLTKEEKAQRQADYDQTVKDLLIPKEEEKRAKLQERTKKFLEGEADPKVQEARQKQLVEKAQQEAEKAQQKIAQSVSETSPLLPASSTSSLLPAAASG